MGWKEELKETRRADYLDDMWPGRSFVFIRNDDLHHTTVILNLSMNKIVGNLRVGQRRRCAGAYWESCSCGGRGATR